MSDQWWSPDAQWPSPVTTSSTGFTGGFTLSTQTAPWAPVHTAHRPDQILSCRQADEASDQLIDGLNAALHEPCPHCGKRRDQ